MWRNYFLESILLPFLKPFINYKIIQHSLVPQKALSLYRTLQPPPLPSLGMLSSIPVPWCHRSLVKVTGLCDCLVTSYPQPMPFLMPKMSFLFDLQWNWDASMCANTAKTPLSYWHEALGLTLQEEELCLAYIQIWCWKWKTQQVEMKHCAQVN